MGFHGCQNAQPTLEAAEVVIDNVILNHTHQRISAGKVTAVVSFPFENAPEALHGAVVNAFSRPRHALSNAGSGQFVMEDLGGVV